MSKTRMQKKQERRLLCLHLAFLAVLAICLGALL